MRLAIRVVVTVLAVALVFGMGVHYAGTEERHWPYPTADDLALDAAAHVGETTLLWGSVESVDDAADTARISVEHDSGSLMLTVHGFDASVEPGGVVQVLGTVEAGDELRAERVVVVNPSAGAERLKIGVSVLGALLVLVVFFREWRFDRDAVAFRRR